MQVLWNMNLFLPSLALTPKLHTGGGHPTSLPPLFCCGQWALMTTHQLRETCVPSRNWSRKVQTYKNRKSGDSDFCSKKKNSLQVPCKQQPPKYTYNIILGIDTLFICNFSGICCTLYKAGVYIPLSPGCHRLTVYHIHYIFFFFLLVLKLFPWSKPEQLRGSNQLLKLFLLFSCSS